MYNLKSKMASFVSFKCSNISFCLKNRKKTKEVGKNSAQYGYCADIYDAVLFTRQGRGLSKMAEQEDCELTSSNGFNLRQNEITIKSLCFECWELQLPISTIPFIIGFEATYVTFSFLNHKIHIIKTALQEFHGDSCGGILRV